MPGTLYIVATPIGNLQDITLRALDCFKKADLIVCEDTRVTSKLLTHYEISKPLRSIHEHSAPGQVAQVIEDLKQGKTIAYVSDAGTPGVNDPGGKLVAAASDAHIKIEPIPGASAVTAIISVCGFPMDEFSYLGFIPHKKGRKTLFEEIAERKTSSIFLESTHRINKTLDSLAETLQPTRLICVGRELTKIYETIYRGTAADVKREIEASSTKGEFTIIVGPKPKG